MNIQEIKDCLANAFAKATIEVKDLTGTGDHISVKIESVDFANCSLVEQHQMVYKALGPAVGKEFQVLLND